ncbi:hypothetical protein L7F22_068843 [Adiantum nelumboides]|nr:hypothetical protein [Adiantum nelumboides]
MAAHQPSSAGQNELGLFSSLSKQVDALCGAYTEKMRQLHSMLDVEEDSRERTARQTAAGRALWNHVIHDPLARFLAGESQLRTLQGKMEEAAGSRETAGVMLAVRTLWFDGKIEAALQQWREGTHVSSHARPQVVLLGAGMPRWQILFCAFSLSLSLESRIESPQRSIQQGLNSERR